MTPTEKRSPQRQKTRLMLDAVEAVVAVEAADAVVVAVVVEVVVAIVAVAVAVAVACSSFRYVSLRDVPSGKKASAADELDVPCAYRNA